MGGHMDEIQLIKKAQHGDKKAYGDLMKLHYRTVEKFAYQCGVRLDDVPDVTQEVFIKFYRFFASIQAGSIYDLASIKSH